MGTTFSGLLAPDPAFAGLLALRLTFAGLLALHLGRFFEKKRRKKLFKRGKLGISLEILLC